MILIKLLFFLSVHLMNTFVTDSCSQITCPSPKTCLMDQQNRPHCVECRIRCPAVTHLFPVCGSDGVSYKSKCHMYEQACSAGKTLRVKHHGVCLPLLESSPFNGMCVLSCVGVINFSTALSACVFFSLLLPLQ